MRTSLAITFGIYLMTINEVQGQTSKENNKPQELAISWQANVAFPKIINTYDTCSNFQMKYF